MLAPEPAPAAGILKDENDIKKDKDKEVKSGRLAGQKVKKDITEDKNDKHDKKVKKDIKKDKKEKKEKKKKR